MHIRICFGIIGMYPADFYIGTYHIRNIIIRSAFHIANGNIIVFIKPEHCFFLYEPVKSRISMAFFARKLIQHRFKTPYDSEKSKTDSASFQKALKGRKHTFEEYVTVKRVVAYDIYPLIQSVSIYSFFCKGIHVNIIFFIVPVLQKTVKAFFGTARCKRRDYK